MSLSEEIHGSGEKKIFFIMGLGISLQGWALQKEYFSSLADYTIVVFDNRGVGYSDIAESKVHSTFELAVDASELLEHIGWHNEVNLVGVSMAGRATAPLKGMIGIALTALMPSKKNEIMAGMLFPETYLRVAAPSDFKPIHIPVTEFYTNKDVFIENSFVRAKLTKPTTLKGLLNQVKSVGNHFVSTDRLNALGDAPHLRILVCTGDTDNVNKLVRPSNSKHLSTHLGAKLIIYEDSGHSLLQQHTVRYNKMIQDWIES
ncbi:hypothetical protein HK099_004290 [Clydaea vesicula]|uniref:AB hydrolase-1 domain-containing protein n=1 Tax=Clydaea vesicula TaxID=447962 RepID=A0AAD5XZH7_9FUNG|nr:hypothetical protein HK099_004290 [Clydaea vesicula]